MTCAFALLVVASCTPENAGCKTDQDCSANAYCDTEVGLCSKPTGDVCRPKCEGVEQCLNAKCGPRYRAIAFRAPTESTVSQGARVAAELVLDFGKTRSDPSELQLDIVSVGTLTTEVMRPSANPPQFEATLPNLPGGEVKLTVRYPAAQLVSEELVLTVAAPN